MMGMRAKKNCMAMLLIVGGIVAVFLAHRKVFFCMSCSGNFYVMFKFFYLLLT